MQFSNERAKLVDNTGNAQGLVMDSGCLVTKNYTEGIATGDVPIHYDILKVGYSNVIGTSLVDLWGVGTAASYVFPTDGIQMQIKAGGNAQDAGSVNFSGTASGGSATTLVDVSKDFTAGGTPVAAGDYIIYTVGNSVEIGIVSSVAATTLTCANGFSSTTSPSGKAYSVIDRSAGGTGVQCIILHYLDTSYQEKETFIVPNGANAVDTTPTDIFRVNRFHAVVAGKTDVAAGAAAAINLVDKATGAIYYAVISAGFNQSQQAIWTVPAKDLLGNTLHNLYITSWQGDGAKATTTPVCTLRLRSSSHEDFYTPSTFHTHDIITVVNAAVQNNFLQPIQIPSRSDVKVSVISDGTGVTFSARFAGWYE